MLSRQDLVEIVERASSRAERVAPDSLPAWASTLSAGREAAAALERESGGPLNARYGNADHPTRFEDLLLPFVLLARERLGERAGASVRQLTQAACAALERSLLQRLARVCAAPLDLEFSIFRTARQSLFTRLLGMRQEDAPRELDRQFIERMLTGGLKDFFREYPVLARLVATLTDFWVDPVAEFLLRLDVDRPDLDAAFSAGVGLGRVAAIDTGLSDPHNRGRSVLAITFESGLKLVYKPRDVGPEKAYFALLAWLNQHGTPLHFRRLRVVRRPGYGWIEFAEHRAPRPQRPSVVTVGRACCSLSCMRFQAEPFYAASRPVFAATLLKPDRSRSVQRCRSLVTGTQCRAVVCPARWLRFRWIRPSRTRCHDCRDGFRRRSSRKSSDSPRHQLRA